MWLLKFLIYIEYIETLINKNKFKLDYINWNINSKYQYRR